MYWGKAPIVGSAGARNLNQMVWWRKLGQIILKRSVLNSAPFFCAPVLLAIERIDHLFGDLFGVKTDGLALFSGFTLLAPFAPAF